MRISKKKLLVAVSFLLLAALSFGLVSCAKKPAVAAINLMEGIIPNKTEGNAKPTGKTLADFGVRLFKETAKSGENTLVSPLSVILALAMTSNGAKEETLSQMENVLGLKREELNVYLKSLVDSLTSGEKSKVQIANSIWFTDSSDFTVSKDFLQTNADYYGSDIYKAPFDDSTLKDINGWVSEKTDGMIGEILDRIPKDAIMYLINALCFEAEWEDVYTEEKVSEGEFTLSSGAKKKVDFMYSSEYSYLRDEKATGFIKYYAGRKYAFAALLPNENVSLSEYIEWLDGNSLIKTISEKSSETVRAYIPKFETEYSVDLAQTLINMGMPLAFDKNRADFTGLGKTNDPSDVLYIGRVLHKTFISVAEKGTRAGAATVVEMLKNSAMPPQEIKTVRLDRPFVYMLIDCETNSPLFIGAAYDIGK